MLLDVAWRNIWRNKKRSAIILLAIALGLGSGLFATGVMFGSWESMVNTSIDRDLSHIQIHTKSFEDDRSITDTIPNSALVIKEIESNSDALVSGRVIIEGMVSSAKSSSGAKIIGVSPGIEKNITSISSKIVEGEYFEGIKRNPIIIGKKLAEKLEVKLRSKIVISFQSLDGNITYTAFRIAGIFTTESSMFDESNVFIRKNDIYKVTDQDGYIHEVAVRLGTIQQVDSLTSSLQKEFNNLSVKSWKDLAPELNLFYELLYIEMYIFIGIILFALLFGITNTMLMSVLDRTKEIGVLMAVGMKRTRVFSMILIETIILSFLGGITGIVIGTLVVTYFKSAGIDLSVFTEGLSSFGLDPVLYPYLPFDFYITLFIMIMFTAIFAALYPALKAIRLNPADAIRTY